MSKQMAKPSPSRWPSVASAPGSLSAVFPGSLAKRTGFLLAKASQRARELSEGSLAPIGIKPRHYCVLALLGEAGPSTQQALGDRLRIDRTSMVGVIDRLERLGFAE